MTNNLKQIDAPVVNNLELIDHQALEWVAKLQSDLHSQQDLDAFERWQSQSQAHSDAYQSAVRLWQAVDSPAQEIYPDYQKEIEAALRAAKTSPKNAWWPQHSLAIACSLMLTVFIGLMIFNNTKALRSDYYTKPGQQMEFQLTDGSTVFMNSNTILNVDFNEHERSIELIEGEAFFKVVKNSSRPFMVKAGKGVTKVTGTQFNVDHYQEDVEVIVKKGEVSVATANQQTTLTAGKQVSYSADQLAAVKTANLHQLAWQNQQLIFDNQTLENVITELNHYYPGQIILLNRSLAVSEVNGVFHIADVHQALTALQESMGLKKHQLGEYLTVLY